MLKIPQKPSDQAQSNYRSLGLSDLPFPTEPVLDPYSYDPRRNGSIYAQSPAQGAIDKFERLLIHPDDFFNRVKLASLWAAGDAQSGRGMGKTALLRFFQQRINSDWGYSLFAGRVSAVVIYVAFPHQVDRRYIEQLAWSALVDTCRSDVLKASRAALRQNALSPQQVKAVVTVDGCQNYDNLLDDVILKANQISPAGLDDEIEHLLQQEGVAHSAAEALARGRFEDYLRSLRRDGNLEPFYIPRDTKGLDYSRTLFFNDVVRYLRAAGFAGGYLFVDDIENLTDQMTRKHRIEFAKEFGLCTVRPGYANTEHNFFSCVLTTHQSSALPLSQAWNEAGLSAMARLDPTAPTSVELPLPTPDQARNIIIAHLDRYRLNTGESGTIKPFTEDGLNALINNSQHPRVLLSSAAHAVLKARDKGSNFIDEETIKEVSDRTDFSSEADFAEGIDDAL